jgi:hypothetical protein
MSELPTEISIAEQAEAAGRQKILPPGAHPDIDEVSERTKAFIRQLPEGHARSLAMTKLGEMIYWMRETRHHP